MVVLKDFSVIAPEPVTLRIGGGDYVEEVDLTVLPAYVSLKIGEFLTAHPEINDITIEETARFLAGVLGRLNTRIDETFLMERCTETQVAQVFAYLLERQTEERLAWHKAHADSATATGSAEGKNE
jgi:hypothetical protein